MSFYALFVDRYKLESLSITIDEYFNDYSGINASLELKKLKLVIPTLNGKEACNIKDIPSELSKLTNFKELYISSFSGTEKNNWSTLSEMKCLRRIWIDSSPLKSIPTIFKELPLLEEICFEHCKKLKNMEGISACVNLKTLLLLYCAEQDDKTIDSLLSLENIQYVRANFNNRQRGRLTKKFKSAIIQSC